MVAVAVVRGMRIAVALRIVNEKEKREPDMSGREEPLMDAGSIVNRAGLPAEDRIRACAASLSGRALTGPQLAGAAAGETV
jgi:hypothetical protein